MTPSTLLFWLSNQFKNSEIAIKLSIAWLKFEVVPEQTQQVYNCTNDLFMWKEVLCDQKGFFNTPI